MCPLPFVLDESVDDIGLFSYMYKYNRLSMIVMYTDVCIIDKCDNTYIYCCDIHIYENSID
jgi:hypothetical protein